MITFRNKTAETVQVGDVMRQTDEFKRYTNIYHYIAESVVRGDILNRIHDLDGNYVGDQIERDVIVIEWSPIHETAGAKQTVKYTPTALVEVATSVVDDYSQLLTYELHDEEA
jgi:hypothetical protein